MKKYFWFAGFIGILLVFSVALSACNKDEEVETNYHEEYNGRTIIHNDAGSGSTIIRIAISDRPFSGYPTTYYNERVTITPGGKSDEYELRLFVIYDLLFSNYRVTITLDDDSTKFADIRAYSDIVNNLYYDGTNLVER